MVILSLSTEPGKGKEERATPQDSLHIEVKSECLQCIPVYLGVHQCVPVFLDVHQCVPVYLDVHQCVPVYLDVHQCVPVYLDVHQCVPVYLRVHQCVPVFLFVHQCVGIPLDNCVLPTIMRSLAMGSKVNNFA